MRQIHQKEDSRMKAGLALLLAAALALAACGGEETVTVTEEAPAPAEEAPAPAEEAPAPPEEASAPDPDAGGDRARVPNVVGENHQYAQDTLQAAGFYALDERDCSGQDRLLLWDRNWVVREQDPAPGTPVSVDRTITLCSVKQGE
jgi:hypothetical protein